MKQIEFEKRKNSDAYTIQIVFETPLRGFSWVDITIQDWEEPILRLTPYKVTLGEFKSKEEMQAYFKDKAEGKWTYKYFANHCINHYMFSLSTAFDVESFLKIFGYELTIDSIREMSKKFEEPYYDKIRKYWK